MNANGALVHSDGYNTTFVEMVAYESVMDAFGRVMVGIMANSLSDVDPALSSLTNTNMSIMSTVLLDTNELAFLGNMSATSSSLNIEQFFADNSMSMARNDTRGLRKAIEELFWNTAISLMNERTLQPNISGLYVPKEVKMTVTSFQNVYSYTAKILWTACAIAIFLTVVRSGMGLLAFLANGQKSYWTQYSTILRIRTKRSSRGR